MEFDDTESSNEYTINHDTQLIIGWEIKKKSLYDFLWKLLKEPELWLRIDDIINDPPKPLADILGDEWRICATHVNYESDMWSCSSYKYAIAYKNVYSGTDLESIKNINIVVPDNVRDLIKKLGSDCYDDGPSVFAQQVSIYVDC